MLKGRTPGFSVWRWHQQLWCQVSQNATRSSRASRNCPWVFRESLRLKEYLEDLLEGLQTVYLLLDRCNKPFLICWLRHKKRRREGKRGTGRTERHSSLPSAKNTIGSFSTVIFTARPCGESPPLNAPLSLGLWQGHAGGAVCEKIHYIKGKLPEFRYDRLLL